jgi:DNA-binding response OmpR family regulator
VRQARADSMRHKILIVDDDEATRVGLAALLADAGYDTITASNVPTAMRALATENPDLLIVDIRLEGYNGLQVILMAPKPIPAIVVTGYVDPMLEGDARRLGADYLVKPVSPPRLRAMVAHKLSRTSDREDFVPARQWPRKRLMNLVPIQLADTEARLVDVSYGGIRLEVHDPRGAELPPALNLTVPAAQMSVPVNIIWKRRSTETTWVYGASIRETAEREWRSFVDTL